MLNIKDFFDMIFLVIIFIGVLALTYFATKKMAGFNRKMAFNKNMQIIEVLQLGQGQYLYIVKVGNDYHLLGVAKESVNYCIKLDETQLNLEVHEDKFFHEYLSHFMRRKQVDSHEKK